MAGLFDQTNFDIRQKREQCAGRFRRGQRVLSAEQMKLRAAKRLQRLACIQLRK
ncbi:hypothetical protein D3C78_1893040 [compost metagenome]